MPRHGKGLEFHIGNKKRGQKPHWHKIRVDSKGKKVKDDTHLEPGTEVEIKSYAQTPHGEARLEQLIRPYLIPPITPGGIIEGIGQGLGRLLPRLLPRIVPGIRG